MYWETDDTIVALSSPPGPGGRAVIRLTGGRSLDIAGQVFHTPLPGEASRSSVAGRLHIAGFAPIPATLLHFAAPRTMTAQAIVELHALSSQPIVDRVIAELLAVGARAARPGEFALRAFLAGKIDLPRAEAILGAIEAGDRDELQRSLRQLAGGVSQPLEQLREDLLNLLADLEAGLDFADEDISFVGRSDVLNRIATALAHVAIAGRKVEDRGLADRPYRVVLVGPPNSGKTSLFNALTGGGGLVSDTPGTTRDYLSARLPHADVAIELFDTAGRHDSADSIDAESQRLGGDVAQSADLVLWCQPGGGHHESHLVVATLADRVPATTGGLAASVVTGQGIDELRDCLVRRARARDERGLAPSLSRCRHHVTASLTHLRNAHQGVLFDDPPEIVALELRTALDHIGAMTGAIFTDDLLDRIFSRFCIGK